MDGGSLRQASYHFATYGDGSTRKNVVFWFHSECCPENDPITEELALEFYLGNKTPEVEPMCSAAKAEEEDLPVPTAKKPKK